MIAVNQLISVLKQISNYRIVSYTLDFIFVTLEERCRSSTAGHIDVGGKTKLENLPKLHSILTLFAQRLCKVIWHQRHVKPV